MKNKMTLFGFLAFLVMQSFYGLASPSHESEMPVPINTGTENPGTGHRTPTIAPIQCYYSDGELTFTFSADLGTVECEVVRLSDEATFDAIFYAVNGGSDSLYVSTDADDYVITLTCADGTIYYGEYTIYE